MDKLQYIHHLLNRAAFGSTFNNLPIYLKLSTKELTQQLFDSSRHYSELNVVDAAFIPYSRQSKLTETEKKELRKKAREEILNLNREWFMKMGKTEAVLREKMTLFWHDHFACRTKNPMFAQDLNNILRRYSLGNFGEMLMAVSKSPAMIMYLNNQQNRAKSPNENFAREVMELFTLGRNNYSEDDIKNAARAFTGWGLNPEGEFIFRRRQHDFGIKNIFGLKGNFDGEDVINIILDRKQTANFISEKIYKYFVNEEIDRERVNLLSTDFYNSGYDIGKLMENIFTSDWFYAAENQNRIIKSPVELLVGYVRLLPFEFTDEKSILLTQRALGQVLFMPPNVGGWPYGEEWINSTSITFRMQLPYTFLSPQKENKTRKRALTFKVDWQEFHNKTKGLNTKELTTLILGRQPNGNEQLLIDKSIRRVEGQWARKAVETVTWLCMPEYQLA